MRECDGGYDGFAAAPQALRKKDTGLFCGFAANAFEANGRER